MSLLKEIAHNPKFGAEIPQGLTALIGLLLGSGQMLKTATLLLAIASLANGSGLSARQAPTATARALHCGYGGVGILPYPLGAPPPPDFDRYSAIAVVEISSTRELQNVAVSAFAIIDQTGAVTPARRIVEVEDFRRVPTPNLGSSAYYENPGGTLPWNGTLPTGLIRLRVRAAITNDQTLLPARFRLTVGPYVIEGPQEGCTIWPT